MAILEKLIMVVGGGIAGIQASLDLADMGFKVDLIERDPCIGGRMAQLDKTLPTNDCSICILAPKLSDCFRHPNIAIHTLTTVEKITRINSHFEVDLLKRARFVKETECINCGQCVEKCPVKVDDEFDMEMRKRKAIYLFYLQGVPPIMTIDKDHCLHLLNAPKKDVCRLCEKACPKNAVDFNQTDKMIQIKPSAIILAVGNKQYNPSPLSKYGYKRFKNIITGLEYERMISASGPTHGFITRLTDNRHPKSIGFIQCVGSRDIKTNRYCSSICCTYATKHAILSKEHDEEIQPFIFYIDLRAGGKGFQNYINRAKNDYCVLYIRSKISEITLDEDNNPILHYEDLETYEIKSQKVDFVVLEVAMIPDYRIEEVSNIFGTDLDNYRFIHSSLQHPLNTNVPGIFMAGCCRGATDIPHSVIEASGAAAKAAEYITIQLHTSNIKK